METEKVPDEQQTEEPYFRVAVVQFETHPSITVEDNDYMAEPFFPDDGHLILAHLRRLEGGDSVRELQNAFRDRYLQWAKARLLATLRWLEKRCPKIIVFPEFSIPFEHLSVLRDFAIDHDCIVIGGNHSYNRGNEDYLKIFNEAKHKEPLGIQVPNVPPHAAEGARSLLVAFAPPDPTSKDSRNRIGIWCRFKEKLSPFEFTSSHVERSDAGPAKFTKEWVWQFTKPLRLNIHTFVCAEALQNVSIDDSAHMLVVCAYHSRPADFERIIEPTIIVQKLAILASDGRDGGSTIALHPDRRFKAWWRDAPSLGCLPKGDGIVVYDVPKTLASAVLGAANPYKHDRLVALASIVSGSRTDDEFIVASEAERIIAEHWKPGNEEMTKAVQYDIARLLRMTLRRYKPAPLQSLKLWYLVRLAELGQLTEYVVDGLSRDCIC